ncbi:hypothetical protein E3N88_17215 [Mikania micrantha]|uniref:Alpha-1,4 glucan phosphorylase n=1 Tax=Mikania micrantha TaxID=192012 RepID=A0A5N6NSL9_9ASTR|nr:hypothetical protein E3N88_17215 [Mikania micrantha]
MRKLPDFQDSWIAGFVKLEQEKMKLKLGRCLEEEDGRGVECEAREMMKWDSIGMIVLFVPDARFEEVKEYVRSGVFGPYNYDELMGSLEGNEGFGRADYFLVGKDFPSYIECQEKVDKAYKDQKIKLVQKKKKNTGGAQVVAGGAPVVRRWGAGGAQVGRRWGAGGAQVGRRWCAGGAPVVLRWGGGGSLIFGRRWKIDLEEDGATGRNQKGRKKK